MKDLYRRNKLRPRETDRVKINNCNGSEEDKEAAFTILLNEDKKAEYDRVHATLSTIGYVRRELGLAGKSNWRIRYGDFLAPPQTHATGGRKSRGQANRKTAKRKTGLRAATVVVGLLALTVIGLSPLAYRALVSDEGQGLSLPPEFEQRMYARSSGVPVYQAPEAASAPVETLVEFQEVNVDPKQSTSRWAYIKLDGERGGYVQKQYLKEGSGEAAQVAKCREYGVWRPESGQHLASGRTGHNTLIVVNPPGLDAAVKLKDHDGDTQVFFYVRGGETVSVDTIPDGRFQFQYAIGENYSPACGRFVDNMQALLDPEFITFATDYEGFDRRSSTATHTLKSGAFNFTVIPNSAF